MLAAMAGIYLLEIDQGELNANFKVGCVMLHCTWGYRVET